MAIALNPFSSLVCARKLIFFLNGISKCSAPKKARVPEDRPKENRTWQRERHSPELTCGERQVVFNDLLDKKRSDFQLDERRRTKAKNKKTL